jgi:predicted nucleic acid-binding protein
MSIAIVDSGPLYASADDDDEAHAAALAVLQRSDLQLVIPALVAGETAYMLSRRLGPRAEATFLTTLEHWDVEAPAPDDWARMGELVEEYASFPLGAVDASVVALAERLGTGVVVTIDRRHFPAIRPRHCDAFHLLPE